MFAGNACSPDCDWVGADHAGMVYATFVIASFAITAVALLIAWRREKDLAWVPLIGVAVTVGRVNPVAVAVRPGDELIECP